jgi:hypothetical protein
MIRVTKTEEESRTVITIDGELLGESLEVVDTCCCRADLNRKPVYLFLRDVTTVDKPGEALLRRLVRKGVHLVARGVYTSYLVETLGPGDAAERTSSVDTEYPAPKVPRKPG